jgi:hypothetical protein
VLATEIIERTAARNLQAYAAGYRQIAARLGAGSISCAGGVAAFTGPESPLTTVKGAGPQISDEELDRIITFYRDSGAANVTFELAPWVTSDSLGRLINRGFRRSGSEDVVVCQLPAQISGSSVPLSNMDRRSWAELLLDSSELARTEPYMTMGLVAASLPGALNIGIVDGRGTCVACAQSVAYDDIVIMGCDATLPPARGRGAQTTLIRERLRLANNAALSWAIAEVAPDSTSERNYLRLGFTIAYNRVHYSLPLT